MLPVNGYEQGSLSVVAGHLYNLQSRVCPQAAQEDSAVLVALVDTLKPQAPVADESLTFSRFRSLYIDSWIIDDAKGLIREFSGKLLKDVQENPDMEATHLRSLGQLNFLLSHDFQATEELLQQENPQNALNTAFMAALKQAKTAFDSRITEIKKYSIIKETNDLIRNLMPMALAKLLIDSCGRFNVAIIDDVKSVFFSKVENASEMAMALVLTKLATSKECRDLLDSVTAPKEESLSWDAIVEMMGVENVTYQVEPAQEAVASAVEGEDEEAIAPSSEIRITDADAKTCALASYLADSGSATFAQALKTATLPRYMADINSLITTGAIKRAVAGFEHCVNFTINGRSSPLLSKISVSSNGSITDGWGAYMTKPFGVVGLAIENDKLWQMHGIIAACEAMQIEDVEASTKEALKSLGFEVSSLLKSDTKRRYEAVPENIIYALAKGNEALAKQGCIAFTSTYDNPIHCALLNAYEEMRTLRARTSHLARVHSAVREVLFDKFVSKDLHEQVALRTIFAQFLGDLQTNLEATKATDAKSFQQLVIKSLPQGDPEPAHIAAVKKFIGTDAFTEAVGQKFDANHFPWNVVPVASAADFGKVYDDSKVSSFEPKSALGLFGMLVNKLKTVQQGNIVYLTSKHHALEFTGSQKAFEDTPQATWDASIKQAKAIMEQEVKKVEVRTFFTKAMGALIGDFYHDIPKEIGKKPTFEEFRSKLLPIALDEFFQAGTAPFHEELDNLFTNFLYEKRKDLFVPFAKTTTPVDGQVIEFSFFADPITSKVAIAMIKDSKVTRVDQTKWLEGNWQIGQIQVPATV